MTFRLAGAGHAWLWLAAGGVAFLLALALSREERRLVSRRAGLGLLGLRLLAVLVLMVALFEPTVTRTVREPARGRVIVAVDVSASMETADPGRPPDERRRLARTLGLGADEPVEALSRREVARRLLEPAGSPVARIAAEHAIEVIAFAREAAPASLASLAETLRRPRSGDDPSALTTDWEPALAKGLGGPEDLPVVGVVLLTDGLRNAPGDPAATIDRLAERGIPVYPVAIGATSPPRDAAVAAIKAPATVSKGDMAHVEVTLKLDGYAGREVTVSLERPGAPPMRRTVRALTDAERPVVAFDVLLEAAGRVPITVSVEGDEGEAGAGAGTLTRPSATLSLRERVDARTDNDRRSATVQVSEERAEVLIVDGEARWEFRYLRNALARDARVALEAVVFQQPGAGGDAASTYGSELPSRAAAEPLDRFDAIVIGDVDPADVTAEVWTRLEAYVGERGGTLIVSPGPRSWPDPQAGDATVRKLLPVLDPRPVAVDLAATDPARPGLPPGVVVTPSSSSLDDPDSWPMLQLAAGPGPSRGVWGGLPRLPWVIAGRAKPGATVLATAPDTSLAVIAAQAYGLGRVLWVGTDGTWRWRHRAGDAYHHKFWGQAVRWASSGRLAAGDAYVRFGPVRPRVAEGEGVRIQARVAASLAGLPPDLLVAARISAAGSPAGDADAVVPLRPVAGQPRLFEADAPPLPRGQYAIRLDVPQLAEAFRLPPSSAGSPPQAPLEVAPRETSELVELAASRAPLEHLARATGGRVLADHEAAQLPPLLRAPTRRAVRIARTPLWDGPGALLLFFGILTVEWVVRKRVGLP